MNPIKDIVIVGGGTSGLIAALYIKSFFSNFNVKIIKSKEIGIIGVGEGSTEHWSKFIRDINIDHRELINKTNATIKLGIVFKDWTSPQSIYAHSVFDNAIKSPLSTLELYNNLVIDSSPNPFILNDLFNQAYYHNKVILTDNLSPSNQYHFDTHKLNNFLSEKCIERDIIIEDHYVKDLILDSNGNINTLITSNELNIIGDFFIDCTGFKRVLLSKLKGKWISYKNYLPVNQAITLPTPLPPDNNIEPYTSATALSSGWAWKIPTQTRYGNGYVFSNEYTTSDQALNEFNKHLGTNIEKVAKDIKFEAGKVDQFWIKNCVGIGLAGSFSEPLEAQSIGFSIIQSQALVDNLLSYQISPTSTISQYNEIIDKSFNNIIDYVQAHYFTSREDTSFWKDKPFELTDFNKNTFTKFSHGISSSFDFSNPSYLMFKFENFYQLYYGLGLITKEKIKKYNTLISKAHQTSWENLYNEYQNSPLSNFISHIDYLKLIKENHSS
jgi:tryptophan halogenase